MNIQEEPSAPSKALEQEITKAEEIIRQQAAKINEQNEKFYDKPENITKYHQTIWNTIFDNSYGQEGEYDSPLNLLVDLRNNLSSGPLRKEIALDHLRQKCLGNESVLSEKHLKGAFIKQLANIEKCAIKNKAVNARRALLEQTEGESKETRFDDLYKKVENQVKEELELYKSKLNEMDLDDLENKFISYAEAESVYISNIYSIAKSYKEGLDEIKDYGDK